MRTEPEALDRSNGGWQRIAELERELAEAQQARERVQQQYEDLQCIYTIAETECDTLRGLLRDIIQHVEMADQAILAAGLQVTAHELRQLRERITAALREGE